MTTILILILIIVIIFALISWILIKKLMEPNAKPLTEEELVLCEKIVNEGKGWPYVCKWALKHRKCPCLPCDRLEKRKKQT